MHRLLSWIVLSLVLGFAPLLFAAGKAEHVVVIVWDGIRPDFISEEHTPALYQLAKTGVAFEAHHSMYCTSTEVNGTAIATGVYPQENGVIANQLYLPDIELLSAVDTQNPDVMRKGNERKGGHYMAATTLPRILQRAGKTSVIAGSKQVVLLNQPDLLPDATLSNVVLFSGATLPASALGPIQRLLGPFPPEADKPSAAPNEPRDEWTTKALVESLWSGAIPAYSLLWLSEPDFSQHATGPGSPKALAAIKSSDRNLARVLQELKERGVQDKTDVFVVSDHGFSTVEKSVDVCETLRAAGFNAFRRFKSTPKKGEILVVGQGGSVLFHVIGHNARLTRELVRFLMQQEFSGVLFTRKPMEGTFTLQQGLIESPNPPDVVLSMRWSAEQSAIGVPGLQISDGSSRPGQGNHGSLSRFDVRNTLVCAGPDFKIGYTNRVSSANVDLVPTILWLLDLKPGGPINGRVLSEALAIEGPTVSPPTTRRLEASYAGKDFVWRQYLQVSQVNKTVYLDEGNGSLTRQ